MPQLIFFQSNVEVFNGLLNVSCMVCSSFVNGKCCRVLSSVKDHVTRMHIIISHCVKITEGARSRILDAICWI